MAQHLRDVNYGKYASICRDNPVDNTTDIPRYVSCRNCLKKMAKHGVELTVGQKRKITKVLP